MTKTLSDNLYEEYLDELLSEIRTMLIKKRHDYGVNNLKRHGAFGILVRIDDKTARLQNLIESIDQTPYVDNETLEDTFMDIAGYAIQGTLMLKDRLR